MFMTCSLFHVFYFQIKQKQKHLMQMDISIYNCVTFVNWTWRQCGYVTKPPQHRLQPIQSHVQYNAQTSYPQKIRMKVSEGLHSVFLVTKPPPNNTINIYLEQWCSDVKHVTSRYYSNSQTWYVDLWLLVWRTKNGNIIHRIGKHDMIFVLTDLAPL